MLIRTTHHYDAGVDDVLWAMTDESALRAKYADQPEGGLLAYRRTGAPAVDIVQERVVRFPVAPDVAKLLVPEPRIHQVEHWSAPDLEGGRLGTIRLTSPGLPVHAVCHVALRPVRGGTTRAETTVDLACDVPVIGGRILDAVARAARRFIDDDAAANEQVLAARTDGSVAIDSRAGSDLADSGPTGNEAPVPA